MTRQERIAALALWITDLAMLIAALACSYGLRYHSGIWRDMTTPTHASVLFGGLTLVVILASFALSRLYDLDVLFGGHGEYATVAKASTYGMATVLILAFLVDKPVSRGALVLTWLLAMVFVGVARFVIRRLIFRLRESGHLVRRWLIVGTDTHAVAVARQLNSQASHGVRVVGFLDDYRPVGSHVIDGLNVLGDPKAVRDVIRQKGVSTLVVAPQAISWESYRDLLELLSEKDLVRIKLAPGLQHLVSTGAQIIDMGFLPLVRLQPLRITGFDALLKRALDYAGALVLMTLLAPFVAFGWVAARIDRAGPLFSQEPVLGRQQERFSSILFALPSEPAPIGWLARRAWGWRRTAAQSRFGKLPNLRNVIAGHMSLVGPRAVPESAGRLDQTWLHNLLRVRPGLTGPTANNGNGRVVGADEQALKDIAYIREYSIWLDLRLLFASLKRTLRRQKSLPTSYRHLSAPVGEVKGPVTTNIAERTT